MHPDLEHLLELQRLDLAAEEARRLIASIPERSAALDEQLDHARGALQQARERKGSNDAGRRELEKEIAAIRVRRSKYSDQTMEVKTNREFHALQKEIEVADAEIGRIEDRLLEVMMEADEIAAAIKAGELGLTQAERDVAAARQALERERDEAARSLDDIARSRSALASGVDPEALALFEKTSRSRRGIAMAEARDGLCSVCHVRIRPQIYQEVRHGDQVVQCESCQRILYFVPPRTAQADASA